MYACIQKTGPRDSAPTSQYSALLLECSRGFAPAAELTDSETVVFSIAGLGLLYGSIEAIAQVIVDRVSSLGLDASIAIAHNADAAILIALCKPGLEIVRPAETEDRLSGLDIKFLPLSPEAEIVLFLWGVRTMGQFARLPEEGVAERLGREAVKWQRLSRGAVTRPLIEVGPDHTFVENLELEYPIAFLDGLIFVIGRILTSLCNRLVMAGLAADEMNVSFHLEDDVKYPQAAICSIAISVHTVAPRRLQFGLFLPKTPEPAQLEMTLSRLRAMVGENNVGVPELIDSHHPHPFRLVPFSIPQPHAASREQSDVFVLSLRYCHPPIESTLVIEENRPVEIADDEVTRKVINTAGPWRLSGDWWNDNEWEREEWDLGLVDGTVCRVARIGERWFLEGIFD
jgi:protein ImuB